MCFGWDRIAPRTGQIPRLMAWPTPVRITPPGAAGAGSPIAPDEGKRWQRTLMGRTVLASAATMTPANLRALYDDDQGGEFINIACIEVDQIQESTI